MNSKNWRGAKHVNGDMTGSVEVEIPLPEGFGALR